MPFIIGLYVFLDKEAPLAQSTWCFSLIKWFLMNQRKMPWRDTPLPYNVWVSEIMLQQTQVATVIPYFERFIKKFPTIQSLAAAHIDDVLKLWAGLGYYSRARNLHKCAQIICAQFDGEFPSTYDGLQELPGIGPYVAAAVASIAFHVPVPVVDGNVFRVFCRFWGIEDDIRLPKVRQLLFERLTPFIERHNPNQFNQSIMELGALVCTPKTPKCDDCPLANECYAKGNSVTHVLPYKSKKAPVPHKTIGVGIIRKGDQFLIAQRKSDQMLGGLWEFPGGKVEENESIESAVIREIKEETGLDVALSHFLIKVNHAFSHFKITLHVYMCDYQSGTPTALSSMAVQWVTLNEMKDYAFPSANKRIISALEKLGIIGSMKESKYIWKTVNLLTGDPLKLTY